MPSKAVSDFFEQQINSWPNAAACPLVDINEVASGPDKPPYVHIEWPVGTEDRKSVGKPAIFREEGGARVIFTVATNQPGWKAQVLAWADELRDLLRAQSFGGGNGETYEASPAIVDERNRDGNRFRVPFAVAYRYDARK